MDPKDALIYDGHDVVVPPKEKNALFLTTRSYEIAEQVHGQCVGLDTCTCASTDQLCEKDCPSKTIGKSGVFTGRCIRNQCEVTTWCPVLDVQYEEQSKTVNPSMKVSGIDQMKITMTVNAKFPKFQQSTQSHITISVTDILRILYSKQLQFDKNVDNQINLAEKYKSMSKSGAVLFVQFVYDCNIDVKSAEHCDPKMYVHQVGHTETEDIGRGGYGFKTVDYFAKGSEEMGKTRRVRYLKGLRFIFDVTGRARMFNFVITMTTIVSGFGFAALAFIAVNEGRLLCENRTAMGKEEGNVEMSGMKKLNENGVMDELEKQGLLEKSE